MKINKSGWASIQQHKAFTLSEILIALVIIGVIATITIPPLVQKQQEQQTVVALKKAYSTLSNAYTLAVQENGTPENWNLTATDSADGANNMLTILAPYLNITKNCGLNAGCFPNLNYLSLDGSTGSYINLNNSPLYSKVKLNDGSLLGFRVRDANCNSQRGSTLQLQTVCAMVYVDNNGDKNPNKIGVDTFVFYITKFGVVPTGTSGETAQIFTSTCNKSNVTIDNGFACAAWVIYNENMDYLHCSDLAWNGKTKCD